MDPRSATGDRPTVAVRVARAADRAHFADLLEEYAVEPFDDAVPADADLCVVDERGFRHAGDALAAWKERQRPRFAPVLLLTAAGDDDPWDRYAEAMGERIDAIQPVPSSKAGLSASVESLLKTRRYSVDLETERRLTDRYFETSPIAITVLDTDGEIVRANERAETLLGLDQSDVVGRRFDAPAWDIVDEDGEPVPSEALPFARVLETGDPVYGFEHGLERPDGDRAWLSVNAAPLRDERGEVERVVASIDDVTERKRLERDLRESEALQRATLSNIRDSVLLTDEDGAFTYVCPNTGHIFGYAADEVRAMGSIDALLGEDPVGPGSLGRDERYENVELTVTDADGEEHVVLVTVDPVSIGEATRLYTVHDVTERKRQAQRFRALIERSSDVVTVVDDDGTIGYLSPAVEAVLGYDQETLVGENVFEHVHAADLDRVREAFDSAFEEAGAPVSVEYRFRHADGSWRWLESVATPRALPDGSHVVNSRDITERVEAQRERARIDESRSLALSAADAGIWEWDLGSDTVHLHESCERLFGLEPGTFDGTLEAFLDCVHRDHRSAVRTALSRTVDRAETDEVTFRIVRRDGTERWVQGRWTILEDDGEPRRLLGVNVDVTEQQERIKQLRVLDDVLRHNFHNHMTVIRGHAESLLGVNDETVVDHAGTIVESSDRLLETTDKQREITKVLTADARRERVDVATLLRSIAESVRERHPDVTVTTDLPATATARAAPALQRAVEELVDNAIRHNDGPEKRVSLVVTREADTVSLTVADNGPGIPEMERAVVTGERNLEPLYHGSGLGLWLVSWIVRRSGGTLAFDDHDGGSVTVGLPAADEEQ